MLLRGYVRLRLSPYPYSPPRHHRQSSGGLNEVGISIEERINHHGTLRCVAGPKTGYLGKGNPHRVGGWVFPYRAGGWAFVELRDWQQANSEIESVESEKEEKSNGSFQMSVAIRCGRVEK